MAGAASGGRAVETGDRLVLAAAASGPLCLPVLLQLPPAALLRGEGTLSPGPWAAASPGSTSPQDSGR